MSEQRRMKRGALRRENAIFIGVWVPKEMAEAIDVAVNYLDIDRSKFLRRALTDKVGRAAAK